jgi:hypothetical protein
MIRAFNCMLNHIKVSCVKNYMRSTCAQCSFRDNCEEGADCIKCEGWLCKKCMRVESGNHSCTECLPETSVVVSKKTPTQPSKSPPEKKEKQD